MAARITRSSIACREEAVIAKLRAVRAPTPELRLEHQRISDKWRQLAETFDRMVVSTLARLIVRGTVESSTKKGGFLWHDERQTKRPRSSW